MTKEDNSGMTPPQWQWIDDEGRRAEMDSRLRGAAETHNAPLPVDRNTVGIHSTLTQFLDRCEAGQQSVYDSLVVAWATGYSAGRLEPSRIVRIGQTHTPEVET